MTEETVAASESPSVAAPAEAIAKAKEEGFTPKALGASLATLLAMEGQRLAEQHHDYGNFMALCSPSVAILIPVIVTYLLEKGKVRKQDKRYEREDGRHVKSRERVVALLDDPNISAAHKKILRSTLETSDARWAQRLMDRSREN
ncbi:hypothetical protein [Streptomyces prunicolor]|uniref:Integral membrane protein n=1 Tax=Streptomyces prunicolor TaxID=67348 RepID=A0ABU4FHU6_9ACTN|nr:hypothetical protein [Streptomyces prunicolor]MDV7220177.1 hypothetical protein [Streptomyces prunicolor]